MRRAVDLGKKLELTSIALGCLTRKELCAAFARINPHTILTLQNSYNWMSGRAAPRSFSLFEDWAQVLELDEGPHFILSSSLMDFARALAHKSLLPENLLGSLEEAPEHDAAPVTGNGSAPWRNGALLKGSFLAISISWSPAQRNRLLVGTMSLGPRAAGRLEARYVEALLGEKVVFQGSGLEDGRTGQLSLQCEANGASYYMSFHLPPLPGNLAGGIFAGNAIYDPNSEPTAGAILFLRNHLLPEKELEAVSGYHDLEEASLARCLALLGYGEESQRQAEGALLGLLLRQGGEPLVALPRAALAQAAALLDQRRLTSLG